MNKRTTLWERCALSKLMLVALLVFGGGNLALADTVIFNGSVDEGWEYKNSTGTTNTPNTNGELYDGGGSYSPKTYTSKNMISITAGQTIKIVAKRSSSLSSSLPIIKVNYSTDKTSWTTLKEYGINDITSNSNWVELEVDANSIIGTYYIQFEFTYVYIQSIILKDAPIMPVLSVSPTTYAFGNVTGSSTFGFSVSNKGVGQMTVNISSDNSEEFSVSPTTLTDIENGSPQTFNVTFNHSTERLGDRNATITVTPTFEGGLPVTISVSATAVDPDAADVILNEYEKTTWTSSYSGTKKILLKYTACDGWNTFCVPFSATNYMNSIFGNGWKAYALSGYADGVLTFEKASYLGAQTPYLVYVETANIHEEGVLIETTSIYGTSASKITKNGATFQGTYAPVDMEGKYGVTGNATIQKGGENSNILGYRAYFTGVSEAPNGARPTIVFSEEEMPTGIGAVQMLENTKDVYNLNGQKVSQTHKGIYIVNGRKVVVK